LDSQKNENESVSKDKLTQILTILNELKGHINSLDDRISHLEGNLGGNLEQKLPIHAGSNENNSTISQKQQRNFNNLDEHLKRTYKTLAKANKPLTASEVAELMGRSRSTTSYHLNQLEKIGVLEKFPSPSRESSRNILFRPKDRFES
jgi:DNA-binding MarR family transcriptional regulator